MAPLRRARLQPGRAPRIAPFVAVSEPTHRGLVSPTLPLVHRIRRHPSGGSGGGSGGASVTFIVVDSALGWGEPNSPPLGGATVAFDPPGAGRVEQVTGADGKVTFTGIDWSKGKAAATAFLDGYALWSGVNLDEARLAKATRVDDAVALPLFAAAAPETVTVKGTLTGLMDAAHSVFVNVVNTNAGTEWIGPSAGTFTVSVPKGAPFMLQAAERSQAYLPSGQGEDMPIFQVLEQSVGATTADMTGVSRFRTWRPRAAARRRRDRRGRGRPPRGSPARPEKLRRRRRRRPW